MSHAITRQATRITTTVDLAVPAATVDPDDDDAEYVHMSSSPRGSNIASTRIDHIELMHTD